MATDPMQDWDGNKQFLVDSASRRGMSGGPAIYFDKLGRVPVNVDSSLTVGRPVFFVHGVYVGRLGRSDNLESQIGVVWKINVVNDIIDQGIGGISTGDFCTNASAIRDSIERLYPNQADNSIYMDNKAAIAELSHELMKELQGRANLDQVRALISEHARKTLV